MQGDRIPGVDQPELRVEQADLVPLAFELRLDRLLTQQRGHDADVLLEGGQLDRAHAHGAPPGEARADADVDAPGRQLVERGEGVGCHRRDAVGWDQHAGAQANARGLDRRRAHGDEAVRAEHLRVVEPGMGEAEILRPLRQLPRVGRGCHGYSELHVTLPTSSLSAAL